MSGAERGGASGDGVGGRGEGDKGGAMTSDNGGGGNGNEDGGGGGGSGDGGGGGGAAQGPFPFAVGPLYLLSRPLAQRVFGGGLVRGLGAEQHFRCRAEDATIGYAVHLAAARDGIELTLAHLPWAKLHNFAEHISPISGPPAAESVVLHYLKGLQPRGGTRGGDAPPVPARRRERHGALWRWIGLAFRNASARRASRCWPPVRFAWRAAERSIRCLDPVAWWLQHRRCTFEPPYCRAPLLGAAHWVQPHGAAWHMPVGSSGESFSRSRSRKAGTAAGTVADTVPR